MGNAGVTFAWRPRDLIGMSSSFVFRKCFQLRWYWAPSSVLTSYDRIPTCLPTLVFTASLVELPGGMNLTMSHFSSSGRSLAPLL